MTGLEARISASARARFGKGVADDVIADAEKALGVRFPISYRWWLQRYGGGHLGGYELQGLAPVKPSEREPDEAFIGDVVWTTSENRARGLPAHLLELVSYEDDEVYYLDLSRSAGDESPVICRHAGQAGFDDVASSFTEFLERQL